jgi:hypothetical protein
MSPFYQNRRIVWDFFLAGQHGFPERGRRLGLCPQKKGRASSLPGTHPPHQNPNPQEEALP